MYDAPGFISVEFLIVMCDNAKTHNYHDSISFFITISMVIVIGKSNRHQ